MMTRKTLPLLKPTLRLSDIFPATHTFNPREPYGGNPFVAEDAQASNALTGGQLSLTGDLRVLCHSDVATEGVLGMINWAGFDCGDHRDLYNGQDAYFSLLTGCKPGTVIFQHAHPPEMADPGLSCIPYSTLTALNNKSSLATLAPASATPKRQIMPTSGPAAAQMWATLPVPVVLKVPSHHSLGSGEGVRICRDKASLRNAVDDFQRAEAVIAEEFIEITENWCVQFACLPGGLVQYLGTAEQIVDPNGRYTGNWISAPEPPQAVIDLGGEIATRGAECGYLGIAGFDVVAAADGRILVLDLNFRVNGSTTGLLYRESLRDVHGPVEIMFRILRDSHGWAHACEAVTDDIWAGRILPFAGYHPAPGSGAAARMSVLATGPTRSDVTSMVASLRRRGLT
jgi:hypothetical protein